jgi:LuxR family transcriptional regulator, maltose regulon positive regulatory protein
VPEGSQLALSARGASALPLEALQARGLALEIGPDDLRMDEADSGQLLSAAGVDLPAEQVAELTLRTEGWSAGLYLAALAIRAGRVDARGTPTFSGSDRLVADYLGAELLAHLSPDDLRFLTQTAVLERISGPLCDAVLQQSGSAAMLKSLARSNLFLVPLDAHGDWCRYHRLFQEMLRSELTRTEPDLVPRLLDRATDWCEANGQPETAIGYAQRAGNVDRVARLVEQCAVPVYQSGRVATAERWLEWLERNGALERNAAVAVLGALDATAQGRPAEAELWAEAAERANYDGVLPDGSPSIDSWRAVLRAQRCQRGVARMRADAELAVRTLARSSPLRPQALLFHALSLWLAGDGDEADDLLADVAENGLELEAAEGAAVALGERAALAIERGAWVEAEELADRALRVIRRSRMGEYPSNAFAYALAARVALHRGETGRAHELLARSQRLRPRLTYAVPYFAVQTRLELARAYLALADAGGAETMLREIDALRRRQPDLGTLTSDGEELRASLKTVRAQAPGISTLTEAELRVLPYLATHLSFREIGERLYLSRHTVKSHAMAIYRKLSVTSRNAAVERAGELGLL